VAETHRDCLFVDVGSTTTDVVPILEGRVAAHGRTDPARLRAGELVYTGALRTPVCAVVRSLPLRGRRCRVAAELFAITADAHLWLRSLEERGYTCDTPDGRGRSREEAGARLARMVCADSESLAPADVTAIAERVAQAQEEQIAAAIAQVKRRLGVACPTRAVLAGQGAFLAEPAARSEGLLTLRLEDDQGMGPDVARAAPAAAVAFLLARER
jgi:probable H4MPT-linked C1 transfer pathway protein